jgi:hypothetical protein
MERQAIRRMEAQTLTPQETERIGLAPEDLNLDLGPMGRLI